MIDVTTETVIGRSAKVTNFMKEWLSGEPGPHVISVVRGGEATAGAGCEADASITGDRGWQ